jgi:hypothetical protein
MPRPTDESTYDYYTRLQFERKQKKKAEEEASNSEEEYFNNNTNTETEDEEQSEEEKQRLRNAREIKKKEEEKQKLKKIKLMKERTQKMKDERDKEKKKKEAERLKKARTAMFKQIRNPTSFKPYKLRELKKKAKVAEAALEEANAISDAAQRLIDKLETDPNVDKVIKEAAFDIADSAGEIRYKAEEAQNAALNNLADMRPIIRKPKKKYNVYGGKYKSKKLKSKSKRLFKQNTRKRKNKSKSK